MTHHQVHLFMSKTNTITFLFSVVFVESTFEYHLNEQRKKIYLFLVKLCIQIKQMLFGKTNLSLVSQ